MLCTVHKTCYNKCIRYEGAKNMKPYIIFSDLDGTLTNTSGDISEQTKSTIKNVLDQGHTFYICTGRMIQSALEVAQSIDSRIGVIGSNGGVIKQDNNLVMNEMTEDTIYPLIDMSFKYNVPLLLFGLDTIIYTLNPPKFFTDDAAKRTSSSNRSHVLELSSVNYPEILDKTRIANAIFITEDLDLQAIIRETLIKTDHYQISSSNFNNIEVTPKETSKGLAIKKVVKLLDFDMSRTVAFGDGNNDIEMLKVAHHGVAMGNATEELKSVAGYFADHTDNQGFSTYLTKFLNSK